MSCKGVCLRRQYLNLTSEMGTLCLYWGPSYMAVLRALEVGCYVGFKYTTWKNIPLQLSWIVSKHSTIKATGMGFVHKTREKDI